MGWWVNHWYHEKISCLALWFSISRKNEYKAQLLHRVSWTCWITHVRWQLRKKCFSCCNFSSSQWENFNRNTSCFRHWKSKSRAHERAFHPKAWTAAALLATHLKDDILKNLTIPVSNTLMWNDRLNSGTKQPIFVPNLIGEILESKILDHVLSCGFTSWVGTTLLVRETEESQRSP